MPAPPANGQAEGEVFGTSFMRARDGDWQGLLTGLVTGTLTP